MPHKQMKETEEKRVVLKKPLPLQNSMNQQRPLSQNLQKCEVSVQDAKKCGGRRKGNERGKVGHVERLPQEEVAAVHMGPPVSSKCLRFQKRPGFGQAGTKCIVKANHFLAQLPDKDLNQYDVRFYTFSLPFHFRQGASFVYLFFNSNEVIVTDKNKNQYDVS